MAEAGSERTRRQTIGGSEMFEVTRRRVEPVQSASRAYVNAPLQVFDYELLRVGLCAVARKPLRCCIANEVRPPFPRIINANQAASRRSEPQSAGVVHIDARDRARRQAIARGEQSENAVAVARNLPIETNPNITSVVFTERPRQAVLRREARPLRHVAKSLAVALPQQEMLRKGGGPNI